MEELMIEERNNDLWCRDDSKKFAVILMYSPPNSTEMKFITSGPYTDNKSKEIMENLLNDVEQCRFACLNSQFVNPKYVVCIKRDIWKEKSNLDKW